MEIIPESRRAALSTLGVTLPTSIPSEKNPTHALYDVIIIGLGAMGSSSLYHCAKAGLKVLGLERFPFPSHSQGSSHGESRIIRRAYYEDPRYVPLLDISYSLWHELESETNTRLLTETGGVDVGPADSDPIKSVIEACHTHNIPYELLDPAATAARFPGVRLPEGYVAVYQSQAGVLAPEKCIDAYFVLSQLHGAHARTRCVAADVSVVSTAALAAQAAANTSSQAGAAAGAAAAAAKACGASEVTAVTTAAGETFYARTVVVTAGAWSADMLAKSSLFTKQAVFGAPVSTADSFAAETAPAAAAAASDAAAAEEAKKAAVAAAAKAAKEAESDPAAAAAEAEADFIKAAAANAAPMRVPLPASLKHALSTLSVERQVVTWYRPRPGTEDNFPVGKFPIFLAHLAEPSHPADTKLVPGGGALAGSYISPLDGGLVRGPTSAYYGFPRFGATEGVKLARYNHRGSSTEPGAVKREVEAADLKVVERLLRDMLPDLVDTRLATKDDVAAAAAAEAASSKGKHAAWKSAADNHGVSGLVEGGPMNHIRSVSCMFTNTPDEHFIIEAVKLVPALPSDGDVVPPLASKIAADAAAAKATDKPAEAVDPSVALAADRLAAAPSLVVIAACSGHGFKFASAVGAAVKDLAQGAQRADLSWFGLGRFQAAAEEAE